MVNNNKILTVSYGTFSCTLEGFDDSFGTMKAIAEYFRDLASDDRYFGAEPPQLDAEMLARIAQRQISSPVAAYENESGIVLRASENDTVDANVADDAATPVEKTSAQEEAKAPVDTVADEKLVTEDLPAATDEPAVEEVTEEDTIEAIADEVSVEKPEIIEVEPTALDISVEDAAIETDSIDVEPTVATPDVTPMQAYVEPEVAEKDDVVPPTDSIAAKLRRIRAVVSRNEASTKSADFTEDEHADAFMGSSSTLQNDEFEDEDLVAADEITEAPIADQIETESDAQDLSEQLAIDDDAQDEIIQEDAAEIEEVTVEEEDTVEYADDESESEIANALAALEAVSATEIADQPVSEETPADPAATEDDNLFGDDEGEEEENKDDDLANLLEDVRAKSKAAQPLGNARVLKIKRTDFEAAIVSGQIEPIDAPIDAPNDATKTTLSDEDEAELLRELAAVEADDADEEAHASATDAESYDPLESDFAYDDDEAPTKSNLPPVADMDDDDLSRLMDATDSKMDEPETTSRREAYSHLRAAVNVANAEQAAGGRVDSDTDDGAYREDLASVVRPRRPEAVTDAKPTQRPSRPEAGISAPLKLVAEQRVDDQAEQAPRGPVRPRRVSAVQVDEAVSASKETKGGFVGFAQEMQATDLPQLLEAAAAYMSFVEGREQFSRPQLMTKVRQVETSNFNREDGLRSFGKLLREGKIQKIGGGRFTAAEDIGFRPDERAAG